MKKFLIVFVLIITTVFAYFIIKKNASLALSGTVLEVNVNDRQLLVKTLDLEEKLIYLDHHTKLFDIKNTPTFLGEINKGFDIKVFFHEKDGLLMADKIKITKAPNIIILSPENNSMVDSFLKIKGIARVFENTLQIEVANPKTKKVLITQTLMANSPDIGFYGNFETQIDLSLFPFTKELNINAFQYSAKDGSLIDKTTHLIKLKDVSESEKLLKIALADINAINDGDCTKTKLVERSTNYNFDIVNQLIKELIKGPTLKEKDAGLTNSIPEETIINSILINNHDLIIDFNKKLDENIAGSCMVSSIYHQIINTFKELNCFENIIISINGRTDEILQP